MGADFICSACPLPSSAEGEKALRDLLSEKIESLSLSKCYALLEDYHYSHEDDISRRIEEDFSEDHLFGVDDIRGFFARQIATEIIEDALEEIIFLQDRRDINHIMLDHKWWIISGGMSWGDSPTEAMNSIDILSSSGILDGLN